MKNSNADSGTRYILSQSKLELGSPEFSSLLMKKISSKNRKRKLLYKGLLYLLIFLGVDAFISILLGLLNVSVFTAQKGEGSFGNDLVTQLHSLTNSVIDNQLMMYSLVVFMMFFLIMKLATASIKYSS